VQAAQGDLAAALKSYNGKSIDSPPSLGTLETVAAVKPATPTSLFL
jgi:hypothetical protein